MTRYSVNYLPQGAVPRELELAVHQPAIPEAKECAPSCTPKPVSAKWWSDDDQDFTLDTIDGEP
jgi:hypothetical protein